MENALRALPYFGMAQYSKKRVTEIEDRSIETSQNDKQREERICFEDRISKTFGTISKAVINMYLKYLKENKRAENRRNI